MYEDENNLYHYSYRKGDGSGTIDTKNYAEDPWDKNQGDKTPKKKGGMTGKIVALALVCAGIWWVNKPGTTSGKSPQQAG